jgi:hypothetical protein
MKSIIMKVWNEFVCLFWNPDVIRHLDSQSHDWFPLNRDNVSEWEGIFTHRMSIFSP